MRTPHTLIIVPLALIALAGCGEEAKRVENVETKPVRIDTNDATDLVNTRDETIDLEDGWTSDAWTELGGRPELWPRDLTPPLKTERATVLEQRDDDRTVVIFSARTTETPDQVKSHLTDQFEGWDAVDAPGIDDVLGAWERGDVHAMVTVRKDEAGATYGVILRPT